MNFRQNRPRFFKKISPKKAQICLFLEKIQVIPFIVGLEKTITKQPIFMSSDIKKITKTASIQSQRDLLERLPADSKLAKRLRKSIHYTETLHGLQIELNKMQEWVRSENKRVLLLFEGRDAAGKSGAIRRFTAHLRPRAMRVVALNKPTEVERGQWYFQRYVPHLPNAGELVFFDRSWYNRAVVEPVNGFCTEEQYRHFMNQVGDFENMLLDDGIYLFKFWFSISKEEQKERLDARREDPLKQWKIGPLDEKAQTLWDDYSRYRNAMFEYTHQAHRPWTIIKTNKKKQARLESIRQVLRQMPYPNKNAELLKEEYPVVQLYQPGLWQED